MRHKNQQRQRFQPEVSHLEGRALLSTFTVSNLADSGAGSLRQAVLASNVVPGPDTIHFAPGLTGEIHLTSGQLDLTDHVTITGPGANRIAVSGNTSRIFQTHNIAATITGLTLENGVSGTTGGAIQETGGTLNLRNDVFVGNTSALGGGAVFNLAGTLYSTANTYTGNSGLRGGAIFNSGTMTVLGDTYTGNTATLTGGAVMNAELVPFLTTTGTIVGSHFTGNSSGLYGGAVVNQNGSSLHMTSDTFLANHAGTDGGAFLNGDHPDEGDSATVTRSTFLANTTGNDGGAINSQANLTLAFSSLEFNTATTGGAVWALNGTLTQIANTIQFNSAPEVFLA